MSKINEGPDGWPIEHTHIPISTVDKLTEIADVVYVGSNTRAHAFFKSLATDEHARRTFRPFT